VGLQRDPRGADIRSGPGAVLDSFSLASMSAASGDLGRIPGRDKRKRVSGDEYVDGRRKEMVRKLREEAGR